MTEYRNRSAEESLAAIEYADILDALAKPRTETPEQKVARIAATRARIQAECDAVQAQIDAGLVEVFDCTER